ncbi:hypothetical protein A1O3_07016 [Capronia epimyces CBS 606.96]|uniref:SGNH hydrolase-type esterase domain-containing protein n=1 Tax=Capronia epimyces CBS 606.96 TaxID=1182542 RepID=W9XJN8_9EURO|nr:uncharacterized protein A1O3_07016 [Capronia epimyces CBS 606.96]EXJ80732.1 hypothetical protein A1O3_07016 [Capronia epimyces CBS 606.96]
MTLYNYAVGGSSCSNTITPSNLTYPRTRVQGPTFPSVLEYAIPAFEADQATTRINTSEAYFQPALTPSDSVFVMWIGTNDLRTGASFLTDSQARGKTISDFTDCVYAALDRLYAAGARTFVLMNTAPLHLAPQFANKTLDDQGTGNVTAMAEKMHQLTTSINSIFKYQTPYEFRVSNRYPLARVALFDVWSLFHVIYFHPDNYFNGTDPADVTGCVRWSKNKASPDSFMWQDDIHPSEQTDRIIAENFVQVLNGSSKYAQYW